MTHTTAAPSPSHDWTDLEQAHAAELRQAYLVELAEDAVVALKLLIAALEAQR